MSASLLSDYCLFSASYFEKRLPNMFNGNATLDWLSVRVLKVLKEHRLLHVLTRFDAVPICKVFHSSQGCWDGFKIKDGLECF